MSKNLEAFLARITDHPKAPGLRDAVTSADRLVDLFRQHAAKINADDALTPVGRRKAMAEAMRDTFGPAFQKTQEAIVDGAKAAREARGKFSIAAPDKTDLVGAMERQEIRAMVRGMKPTERMAFLHSNGDERIADAVLSAPAKLSGLADQHLHEYRDRVLERRFGAEVAQVREIEDAVAEADAAMKVLSAEMCSISELDGQTFSQAIGATPAGGIPWLKRMGDDVVRIIPGASTAPLATAEDLRVGKFYADYAAYLADHGGNDPNVVPMRPSAA